MGETVVLIIDEAQNLTYPVMEEIRLLTNLETSTEKLLQIILSGQPELEEKLKLPQLRQLRQRIMLRCKTSALSKEQTQSYIVERLKIAGASGDAIFSPAAVDAIHIYSLGIPRVINLLCEHSLVNGFVEQQRPIQPKIVEEVAREFQLDEVEPIAPMAAPESIPTFIIRKPSSRIWVKLSPASASIPPSPRANESKQITTSPGSRPCVCGASSWSFLVGMTILR